MNFFIVAFLTLCLSGSFSAITFSHPSSTIKILSGGNFILNKPLANCNGTLIKESGGTVSGSAIYFNEGIYKEVGNDLTLTATYNPTGTITLAGNNIVRASPGQFLEAISIQGTNNRIEGQPFIFNTITLTDSVTTVTFDLQSTLNSSPILNSGTINLEDTLRFNNGTFFQGPGTINAANNTILVEGKPLTITQPLLFKNANIFLKNDLTTLQSILSFSSGTSALQGTGNVVQFSTNGGLNLASGATLYISDLILKGLGSSINPFIFADSTSSLYLSNVILEFDNSVTTTTGRITVNGPATTALRSFFWTINQQSAMTIDSSTLWQDPLGSTLPGSILFGSPQSNYLSLVNSGTIKTLSNQDVIQPDLTYLINTVIGTTINNASGSITLDNEKVNYLTIDPTIALNLTMSNNSSIYLADTPIIFKSGDTLQVNGPGNIIYVSNLFTINGTITLNTDSELIFEFTDQGDVRTVTFANPSNLSNQIVLSPQTTMMFRNTGSTILSNGMVIQFNGTTNSDKPRFIMKEDANLLLADGTTTATLKGIGALHVQKGSTFFLDSDQHMIIGTNSAHDNLDIAVEDAAIEVSGGMLSIANATSTLTFEQEGELIIGDQGIVELNTLNEIAAPGSIQVVEFNNGGVLTIEQGGTLFIGDNTAASSLSLNTQGGFMEGGGVVTLASQPAFSGVIVPNAAINLVNASAFQLVSSLVSQQPKLKVSVLFIGSNGNKYLRLKNGIIVQLQKGDTITEDVTSTGFVYGMNGETSFFIDLNGRKRAR